LLRFPIRTLKVASTKDTQTLFVNLQCLRGETQQTTVIWQQREKEAVQIDLETGKILGAIYCLWANFPCFFQKKDSPISIFFKSDLPKFYRIKLFYLKNSPNFIENIKSP